MKNTDRAMEDLKNEIRHLNQIVDLQLVEIERLRALLSGHAAHKSIIGSEVFCLRDQTKEKLYSFA